MPEYVYTDQVERTFIGTGNSPTTYVVRAGVRVDAPVGSPVDLWPGDHLVTDLPLRHPFLTDTDHPSQTDRPPVGDPSYLPEVQRIPIEPARPARRPTPKE